MELKNSLYELDILVFKCLTAQPFFSIYQVIFKPKSWLNYEMEKDKALFYD